MSQFYSKAAAFTSGFRLPCVTLHNFTDNTSLCLGISYVSIV